MLEQTLKLFLSLDDDLKHTSDEDRLCELAVSRVGHALEADNGSIMLLMPGDEHLRIAAALGLPEMIRLTAVSVGNSPAGQVIRSRKPLRLTGESASSIHRNFHRPYSAVIAPLCAGQRVLGAISLNILSPEREFTESDLQLLAVAANRVGVALENAELTRRQKGYFLQTVKALIYAIETKDPYTAGHCERVAEYSLVIATATNRSSDEMEDIRLAALLHDLGKVGVPGEILSNTRPLSEDEFAAIRTHTDRAFAIAAAAGLPPQVAQAIRHHHERVDGKGYPDGLSGQLIPLEARIIAVADVYDAMTTGLPSRSASTHEVAIAELVRVSGSQIDPSLVGAFITACERTPRRVLERLTANRWLPPAKRKVAVLEPPFAH